MFLDDKLKQIWDDSGCGQTGCNAATLQALMDECYSRIDKSNPKSSIKRIDSSYQLFAKSRNLTLTTFRRYYIANGKIRAKELGWDNIEGKMRTLCKDLGWNYDEITMND